jgi:hypothetical protein
MKKALLPAFSLALCLTAAGCTDSDWNRMLNYGGMGADEAAPSMDGVEPPAPQAASHAEAQAAAASAAPVLPSNADFCKNVAAQDATRNGFDPATQQAVFQRSFTQCVAIYTR